MRTPTRLRRVAGPMAAVVVAGVGFAGCGSNGDKLNSQAFRTKLIKQLGGGTIPESAKAPIADCAISKLEGEGYKNEGDVPKSKARDAGRICALQVAGQQSGANAPQGTATSP